MKKKISCSVKKGNIKYLLSYYLARKIIKVKKIYLRSPLTCKLNNGICQICYGWNLANGRMSELGETIGIIAAQSIGEPGTQLTMRTFHTGGIFSGKAMQIITSPVSGIINYNSKNKGKKIITKFNEKAFLNFRKMKLQIKENNFKHYKIIIPENSLLFVKPNQKVYFKQILAQVTKKSKKVKKIKEIKEIKTSISGLTVMEKNKIWVLNGNLLFYPQFYLNIQKNISRKKIDHRHKHIYKYTLNLSPIHLGMVKTKKQLKQKLQSYLMEKNIKNNKQILFNKRKADQLITIDSSIYHIKNIINKNEMIKNTRYLNYHSNHIIQKRKKHILLRKSKSYTITKRTKETLESFKTIHKNFTLFNIIYKKQKAEDIVQGLPKVEELLEIKKVSKSKIIQNNPNQKLKNFVLIFKNNYTQEIATKKAIEKIQKYLVNKIQSVYLSQNVNISDKHLEIIIKQMSSKVIITNSKESEFMPGEIIDLNRIEKDNFTLKNKISYEPVILGISKLAQINYSFISQSSFQETIKTLSNSALKGNIDWLQGLKENIIIGNLIPAGTNEETEIKGISK